jgi:hypothetical protein
MECQILDTKNQTMLNNIRYYEDPPLVFGGGSEAVDPRDGLVLFGPYETWGKKASFNAYTISAGVIGTSEAITKFKKFVDEIKKPIISLKRNKKGIKVSNELQRPSFPGFESVFNIVWPSVPEKEIEIKPIEIQGIFQQEKKRKVRTNKIVDLYLDKIFKSTVKEDAQINIWFVLVPKSVYDNCRSKKGSGTEFKKSTIQFLTRIRSAEPALFSEQEMYGEELSKIFETSSDFHHLIKAKANQRRLEAPIQIMVEPKLEFRDIETNIPYGDDMKAFMAWSLSTTLYYKLGKKPWKLAAIRKGVCYLGLVFKRLPAKENGEMICSGAQLFLADGDGTVFRGNDGLWLNEKTKEHHLDHKEAYHLLSLALADYHESNSATYPEELFIHGRAVFTDDEWSGFEKAVKDKKATTRLIGIVIKDKAPIKLFRDVENEKANYGVMRGIAAIINNKQAYLFTRGFIPRLNTSSSMETPNPLHVEVARGEAEIDAVLQDVLALTKLNYNSCIYGDGKPVTLRFSDNIGSILTATDNWKEERRQFRFYI